MVIFAVEKHKNKILKNNFKEKEIIKINALDDDGDVVPF